MYGFKPQCTCINEWFSKLEGFLHLRRMNKSKTFPPIGNESLPLSKNTTLTDYHIMYPMKYKDICYHDPRFIKPSGLMFDDIIMDIIRNNKLGLQLKKMLVFYTDWKQYQLYVQGVTSIFLLEKRNLQVSRSSMCTFPFFKLIWNIIWPTYLKVTLQVVIWVKR